MAIKHGPPLGSVEAFFVHSELPFEGYARPFIFSIQAHFADNPVQNTLRLFFALPRSTFNRTISTRRHAISICPLETSVGAYQPPSTNPAYVDEHFLA